MKKAKSTAAGVAVPQSREECAARIKDLGDAQREEQRLLANMNDQVAAAAAQYQPGIDAARERQAELMDAIQTWCEANRLDLTQGGRVKSAQLVTGEVQWRQRPPSVTVRKVEQVLAALHQLGLGRFVRSKDEVDKEAILKEPQAVKGVPGIVINTGLEDFCVTPFEAQAPSTPALVGA